MSGVSFAISSTDGPVGAAAVLVVVVVFFNVAADDDEGGDGLEDLLEFVFELLAKFMREGKKDLLDLGGAEDDEVCGADGVVWDGEVAIAVVREVRIKAALFAVGLSAPNWDAMAIREPMEGSDLRADQRMGERGQRGGIRSWNRLYKGKNGGRLRVPALAPTLAPRPTAAEVPAIAETVAAAAVSPATVPTPAAIAAVADAGKNLFDQGRAYTRCVNIVSQEGDERGLGKCCTHAMTAATEARETPAMAAADWVAEYRFLIVSLWASTVNQT